MAVDRYAYERVSERAAELLRRERSRHFGHTGTTLIFEPGPLGRPGGGVDFTAIRYAIEASLHRAPGYRRRLRRVPLENHPVWVDDPEFRLDYHVRHTGLPRPGTVQQLRKVAARIHSQRLDRSRPLWEYWVMEGLEGGRFALHTKTHAALVEGAGVDLLQVLLSSDPDAPLEDVPPYRPRPLPSVAELFYEEVIRDARLARRWLAQLRSLAPGQEVWNRRLREGVHEFAGLLGYTLRKSPDTPLNGKVGPHRRFDHLSLPLSAAEGIRRAWGGTILDVVLAALTGAVARYLELHYVNPGMLDFRVALPVGLGVDTAHTVGEWNVELPIWERDPERRHAFLRQATEALRHHGPAAPRRGLYDERRWQSSKVPAEGLSMLMSQTPVHLRLAYFPGPSEPLYLRGARMVECYGKIPITQNAGMGVAVFGYEDKLFWGLNADFDLIPDLARFSEALRLSYRSLERAAAGRPLTLVGAADGA